MRGTLATLLQRAVLGLGATMLLATAGAPAKAEIIDITLTVIQDIPSIGELGDVNNVVALIDLTGLGVLPGSELIGFGYEVELTAFDPSWLSELSLLVTDSGINEGFAVAPGFADDNPGTGSYSSNGVIILDDLGIPGVGSFVLPDGFVRLEFFEGFDDPGVDPDGAWLVDSVLTLRVNVVPEPSSVVLSLSGLGVLALVRFRGARKRAA